MQNTEVHLNQRLRCGATLMELILSLALATILVLTVGVLLDGGHRAWLRTYASVHGSIRQDARALAAAFGIIGRRSNRSNYVLYEIEDGTFFPAVPPPDASDAVVGGAALEFRYWDVELDASDSYGLMNPAKEATAYALLYVDGSQLKVDYGSYPPGGVPEGGGSRNQTGIQTVVLAENVSADPNLDPFSHTTAAGSGLGSVRMHIVLTDPDNGDTQTVIAATLMRNIWPR